MFFRFSSYVKSNILKTFFKENSDSLFVNSSFYFKSSYFSEKFFSYCNFYNIYSRFSNPTSKYLEKKISFFEYCKYGLTFSSGMSAIVSLFIIFLIPSNHFYSSLNVFGSTLNFFSNLLFKFNIIVIFINFLKINSLFFNIFFIKIFFFETPSNPLIKIYDINIISYISKKYNILFFIDNTISTPIIQNPIIYFVDFLLHSCTKFLDGQGRVLGGIVLTNDYFLFLNVFSFLRFSGFCLSTFDSWLIFKSLEHLILRIKFQIYNSYFFLKIFKYNFFISNLFFSGLLNYNQYKIFKFQQISYNSLFSFIIKGITFEMQRLNCWKLVDNIFFISTSNLGDLCTLVTICSITTHNFLSFLEKFYLNICESLLRISYGSEDFFDIYYNISFTFNYI